MPEIVKKKLKYELGIEVDATNCEKKKNVILIRNLS